MASLLHYLFLLFGAVSYASAFSCKYYKKSVHLGIVVADPGTFSGTPEDFYYAKYIKDQVKIPSNETNCASASVGTLLGQKVLLVTTGIGPLTAALCITELLLCRHFIYNIVYSGTAGTPFQRGGVLNADGKGPNQSPKILRYGDICISPLSVNWDCQLTDWSSTCSGYPNVDTFPGLFGDPTVTSLYGQCIYTDIFRGDDSLAQSIKEATLTYHSRQSAPARPPAILYDESAYIGNMTAGTNITYDYSSTLPFKVFSSDDGCLEIDGQFFFSGVPWEIAARNFTAEGLNQAYGTTKYSQYNVVLANAEEGVGVSAAIQSYNNLHPGRKVPFTAVRAMTDYLHAPVVKLADGTWREIDFSQDFTGGYGYGIATYSHAVLSWLRVKCIALIEKGKIKGTKNDVCSFRITVPSDLARKRK